MWFDARAKLAEIAGQPVATSANLANLHLVKGAEFAEFAEFAKPPPGARPDDPSAAPYGESPGGRVLTWTGRVVSLDAWRDLTEWERHGPRGRHWCGLSRQWKGEI